MKRAFLAVTLLGTMLAASPLIASAQDRYDSRGHHNQERAYAYQGHAQDRDWQRDDRGGREWRANESRDQGWRDRYSSGYRGSYYSGQTYYSSTPAYRYGHTYGYVQAPCR